MGMKIAFVCRNITSEFINLLIDIEKCHLNHYLYDCFVILLFLYE